MIISWGKASDSLRKTPKKGKCFHCGKRLIGPFIEWEGVNKTIGLCPECAMYMATRLIHDCVMLSVGKKSYKNHHRTSKRQKEK
jgi:hypothetical protein